MKQKSTTKWLELVLVDLLHECLVIRPPHHRGAQFCVGMTHSAHLQGTCFGVSSLVGDAADGLQEALFVTVGVELELCSGVVTELDDRHLSHDTDACHKVQRSNLCVCF